MTGFHFEYNLEEEIEKAKKEQHEKFSRDAMDQLGCLGDLSSAVITLSEEDEEFNKEVIYAISDKIGEKFFKQLFEHLDNDLKKYENSYLEGKCFFSMWFINLFVGAQRYVKKYTHPDDINIMFEKMIEELKRLMKETGEK